MQGSRYWEPTAYISLDDLITGVTPRISTRPDVSDIGLVGTIAAELVVIANLCFEATGRMSAVGAPS